PGYDSPAATRRSLYRRDRRRAARGRCRMRDTRGIFAGAVAVDRALAGGEKGFPRNAGRIVDPGFLAFGIAAGHLALFDDGAARLVQSIIDLGQLAFVLDLDAQMIEARLFAARRDAEVHARIVEHPFRVV